MLARMSSMLLGGRESCIVAGPPVTATPTQTTVVAIVPTAKELVMK